MKSITLKICNILMILFIGFFIYQNVVLLSLMKSEDIKLIYPYHHEIFYNRIIYYENEISTYTNFTVNSVFKIIFNFIQSIGIVEICYILLSIPLFLNEEKDNRIYKIYMSFYEVFLLKLGLCILIFIIAFLTFSIDISIAWLIIKIIFILSILYCVFCLIKLIKYLFN